MAIVYSPTIKSARMTVVRDAIDGGTGPGKIQIWDFALSALLVEIPFEDPCGTVSGPTLSFAIPIQEPIALETGTGAKAKIVTSAGTVVGDGLTVGTVGTDIVLNSTQITAGEPVTITAASITHG